MADTVCENYAVILPSLKPTEKLLQVVEGVKAQGFSQIVVVDDGSGPDYADWFKKAAEEGCTVLTHQVNRGKGAALRTAYQWLLENRPEISGVVTADADGQHLPKDIYACAADCDAAGKDFKGIVLGCRDFSQPDVPFKSRNGNRITRGVFRTLCGIKISDTQTGLRAFPMSVMEFMLRIGGDRYEYETNVLLEVKRAGYDFREVTITTVYEDNNKGSHFRPLRDGWRIYKLIFKFMLSSGASTLVDYAAFYLAMLLLSNVLGGHRILVCTVIARAISSFINFTMNKQLVFTCRTAYRKTLLRYYALCIPQMLLSAGLLWCITTLVGSESSTVITLLKIPVDIVLFLASFQIQREWVFKQKREK